MLDEMQGQVGMPDVPETDLGAVGMTEGTHETPLAEGEADRAASVGMSARDGAGQAFDAKETAVPENESLSATDESVGSGDDTDIFDAEFDAMFKARYVAALVSAGPSLAMEERILGNLRAAEAIRAESLAAGQVPPGGDALTNAAIERATGQAPVRPSAMAVAPDTETAAQMQAHLELVSGGASAAANTSQLDAATRTTGARGNRFFRRIASIVGPEHRTMQMAAALLAGLLVIGVARGVTHAVKGSASNEAAPTPPAATEKAEADATVGEYDYELVGEESVVGAAAEPIDWRASACPEVKLSTGETLEVVFGDNGPEEVDPTIVGEYVETAEATGPNGTLECEVFHIIAQSEGDGALYAVSYADDATFFLARVK